VSVPRRSVCSYTDWSLLPRSTGSECHPRSVCFHILTCPSLCALQEVSALHPLSLSLDLTCPYLYALQEVSALACSVRFHVLIYHVLYFPGGERYLLTLFVSVP
jgi:hypothetical protein